MGPVFTEMAQWRGAMRERWPRCRFQMLGVLASWRDTKCASHRIVPAQGTGGEAELIARIVEAEAMDDLGEAQADDVAPVAEVPGMVFGLMPLDDPGQTVGRNEIAELAKDGEFRRG